MGVGIQILEHGAFDADEIDLTKGLLALRRTYRGDGVVVIDCGANIGVHTIEWSKHMDGWGSILAIEAQERVYYALAGNIAINNCFNARAMHAVISSAVGKTWVPILSHQEPASFGSLEVTEPPGTEQIGLKTITAGPRLRNSDDHPGLAESEPLRSRRCEGMELKVEGARNDPAASPGDPREFIKTDKTELVRKLNEHGYRTFDSGQNPRDPSIRSKPEPREPRSPS